MTPSPQPATITHQQGTQLSQYPFPPPPYTPPVVDPRAWGVPQPSAPARSASIWQFIVGGILFLLGTCLGATILAIPDDMISQILSQQHLQLPQMENLTPIQAVRVAFGCTSGVMLAVGTLLLVLAFFVRGGGRKAMILSIIALSLVTAFGLLDLISTVVQAAGNPAAIFGLPIVGGFLALCIVTIVKLIGAQNMAGSAQAQAMQQAYYWMMQYQQQVPTQGYGAYGYAQYPAPPAPPPAAPPSPVAPPPPPPPAQNPPQPPGENPL